MASEDSGHRQLVLLYCHRHIPHFIASDIHTHHTKVPHTNQTNSQHSRGHVRQHQQRPRREARRRARQQSRRAHARLAGRRKSITINHPLHIPRKATREEPPADSLGQNARIERWTEAFSQDLGEGFMRDGERALEEGVLVGGKLIK
jgi:hypothetical protein